jgi:hypothetical protein
MAIDGGGGCVWAVCYSSHVYVQIGCLFCRDLNLDKWSQVADRNREDIMSFDPMSFACAKYVDALSTSQ